METRKTIIKVLNKKDFVHKEAKNAFRIWTVVHNDEGGWVDEDIRVHVWPDKSIFISQANDCVSIPAEMSNDFIKALLDLLSGEAAEK